MDRTKNRFPQPTQGTDSYNDVTYYQILGVDKHATATEIGHAYFRLKTVYTSGNQALYSLINEEELVATVARIEQAYSVLYNASRRKSYDQEMVLCADFDAPIPVGAPIKQNAKLEVISNFSPSLMPSVAPESVAPAVEKQGLGDMGAGHSKIQRIRGAAVGAVNPEIRQAIDAMIASVGVVDGQFLRVLRETVGVGKEEMQLNTKISLNFLENLESDRIADMPQVTYAKGFVKSYLRYLGINEGKELIDSYFMRGASCNGRATT